MTDQPELIFQADIENPELSILIPVHNGAVLVKDTLDSIRRQAGVRFELVVIDDGSTDNTLDVLKACRQGDMTLLHVAVNQGCAAARNALLPWARATWVCPFDADDLMLPDRLAPYFRFAQSQTDAPWACCGVLLADADGKPRTHAMGQPFDAVGMLEANIVNHGMTLIRREALEATGGYEIGIARGIDYSMMLKLTLQGSPAYYNEINYLYRMSPSSITHTKEYPLQAIHQRFRSWLMDRAAELRYEARARHLLDILDLHDAVRKNDWVRVGDAAERIRLMEPDSFECEKYRILSLVMRKRFDEASSALTTWITTHPLMGMTGPALRRRQAEHRWLIDQALRLAAGAQRKELLPLFLPFARSMQQEEPTPIMEKLIAACSRLTP